MEIYAEYFFLENLIADGAITALTLKLWRKKIKKGRFAAAVLLMTLYSFTVFIPLWGILNSFSVKIAFSLIIVKILFPKSDRKAFAQAAVTFFGVGIVMGGAVSFTLYILGTEGISSAGTVYVYPSSYPVILICIAASGFFMYFFFEVLSDKRKRADLIVEIKLEIGDRSYCLKGYIDTGNTLREPIGGRPVMIGEADSIRNIIDDNYEKNGVCIIPYCSVGMESGTLIGIEVDRVLIKEGRKEYIGAPAVLAIYNGSFGIEEGCSVILHPDILEKGAVDKCC